MRHRPQRSRVSRADLLALGLHPRRHLGFRWRAALGVLVCIGAVAALATWRAVGPWTARGAGTSASATMGQSMRPGTLAFVRDGQIVLAPRSGRPRRLTSFAPQDGDPTHWGPLMWAPDARHLAVAIGTPLVAHNQLATATGALYVVDTRTGAATLAAPRHASDPGIAVGVSTYAWHGADTLLFAAAGAAFSYSLASQTAAPVTGLVGRVLELELRGSALYYSAYQPADAPLMVLGVTLRRHDLVTGGDQEVADLGVALFQATGCNDVGCQAAPGAASMAPAWDVSRDERRLAFERLTAFAADRASATASFWYSTLTRESTTPMPTSGALGTPQPIFTDAPPTLPAGDSGMCCYLRFAPDGNGLVLSSGYAIPSDYGPYLLYTQQLGRGAQVGYPWAFGPAAWTPDATSFALEEHHRNSATTSLLAYANQRTVLLQVNAYDGAWA